MRPSTLMIALCALSAPALAFDFLDDMIFSAKCAGADDKAQCKAQAKREADEGRERLRGNGASAAQSSAAAQTGERSNQCHTVRASGKTDIDIAYARGKTRFGFMTLDEKKHYLRHGSRGVMWMDDSFKHTAVRGALYDLNDLVSFAPDGAGPQSFYASLRLMKSERGTDLEARYCITASQAGMRKALEGAFVALVRPSE